MKDRRLLWPTVFLMILLLKAPTLNLPYHWDEMGYVIPNALQLYRNGLNPSSLFYEENVARDMGHPPLWFYILAGVYTVFGESPITSHATVAFFSFIGVYYTVKLGSLLYNQRVGFAAALLLYLSPMYFAQSGIAHIAVPLTAATAATLYYAIAGNLFGYLVAATCLVLFKTPGAFTVAAVAVYVFFRGRRVKDLLAYSLPALPLLAWLFYHKLAAGWAFNPGYVLRDNPLGILFYAVSLTHVMLLENNILALTAFTLALIFYGGKKLAYNTLNPWKNELLLFAGITTLNILSYSMIVGGLPRYLLPIYPMYFIFCARVLDSADKRAARLILVLVLSFFVLGWTHGLVSHIEDFDRLPYTMETNMNYVKVVRLHMEVAAYLAKEHPGGTVWARWPFTDELENTYLHYVDKPLKVTSDPPQMCETDLILYSPDAYIYRAGEVFERIRRCGAKETKRFGDGKNHVRVYLNEALGQKCEFLLWV